MPDTTISSVPCSVCGRSDPPPAPAPKSPWLHSTLGVAVVAGSVYFLYQLADMFSKIQNFEIYTTPPGISDLLKLLATVIVIGAAGIGINVKALISTVAGGFLGGGKE